MLLLIILLLFIWLAFLAGTKRAQSLVAIFICMYVSVIVGFRAESVGSDTSRYYGIFRELNNYASGENRELFFVFFNQIIGFFTENASIFTFIVALITLVNITIFIIKYSPSIALSWFTFIGVFSFFGLTNIVRQHLAISIVLLGIPFIFKKRILLFFAVTFFASLIHASAIFTFVIYFLYRTKIKTVILFFACLISIPFIFNPGLAFNIFLMLEFLIPSQFSQYFYDDNVFGQVYSHNSGLGTLIIQGFILIQLAALYMLKSKDAISSLGIDKQKKYIFFITASLIYFIANNVFGLIPIIGRIFAIFFMISIVALPIAITSLRLEKRSQYIVNILFSLYCSLVFLSVIVGGVSNGAFPFIVLLPL